MVERETAKLKEVKDLFKGEYKQSTDINTPHRIKTDKDTFSRVNVLATVEDTYMNPDESYGSIQITDNTATIRVKVFQEQTNLIEGIEKGDMVKVIGKIREDEEGRFLLGEAIQKIDDPKYAKLRELDIKQHEKIGIGKEPTENQEEPKEDKEDKTMEKEETDEDESFVQETEVVE